MDLIKSGSYIDIFYAKTCATTEISKVAGYCVVLGMLLFIISDAFQRIFSIFFTRYLCFSKNKLGMAFSYKYGALRIKPALR